MFAMYFLIFGQINTMSMFNIISEVDHVFRLDLNITILWYFK